MNEDNDSPYTVRGRANVGALVQLFSGATSLGTTNADQSRDWSMVVDFEQRFSEGAVPLEVTSEGITAPAVTVIYDMTNQASSANNTQSLNGTLSITWTASDEKPPIQTSGLASTQLWCRPPGSAWANTGYTQGGTSVAFYYTPANGDGTYFFATRSVDRADNWEDEPNGDGDRSFNYIAPTNPNNPTGKEGGGGGCFIITAASD